MTRPRAALPARHVWAPFLAAIGAVTAAGLVWLSQTSALAATGTRIVELEQTHQVLLERRAVALLAFAAASDSARLEARATALGFGPPEAVDYVTVLPQRSVAADPSLEAGSPLAVVLAGAPAAAPSEPGLVARVLGVGPRPVAAAERPAVAAIGGAGP